jgi:hypothetical protein
LRHEAVIHGGALGRLRQALRARTRGHGEHRQAAQQGAQQVGLIGAHRDSEFGLRGEFEHGAVVGAEAVAARAQACLEQACGASAVVERRLHLLAGRKLQRAAAGGSPAKGEGEVGGMGTRAEIAHGNQDAPEAGVVSGRAQAKLADADVLGTALGRKQAEIGRPILRQGSLSRERAPTAGEHDFAGRAGVAREGAAGEFHGLREVQRRGAGCCAAHGGLHLAMVRFECCHRRGQAIHVHHHHADVCQRYALRLIE